MSQYDPADIHPVPRASHGRHPSEPQQSTPGWNARPGVSGAWKGAAVSTSWRTGCLVLALLMAVQQQVHAEEVGAAPPAKPEDAAPQAAEATPAQVETPAAPGENDIPVHGYLKSRYVARRTGEASDQDLYETLSLDVGDPGRHAVTAHFLGDLSIDLDGNTDNQGYYAFDSARDSKGSPGVGQVYSAYLDFHPESSLSILRAGRQSIYETPEVSFFDGLRLETDELGGHRLKLGAYGGTPVYLYQGHSSGDVLGGAYAEGHLWKGSRARVDYQHIEGSNGTERFENTLIGVDAWQSLGRYVDLHAHYTRMDEEDRDILVRGTFNQPVWDLRFQASYYQLLQTRQNAVIEADSYYPILKDYVPYGEVRCLLSKGFGDHVNVDAGADLRRLTDEDQASEFNNEFDRYFATLDLFDLVVQGSSLSLTGEKWVSDGKDTESQGFDLTCPVGQKSKVSLGTAHYLYKYDYYADEERDDVQSYYLKFEYKYSKALRLSADYTYEDDSSSSTYNELRCEAICSF